MAKLRSLLTAYREQLAYLVVGCLTTLINYVIFALMTRVLLVRYPPDTPELRNWLLIASNVAAWVGAVCFAYFANGTWVYRSGSRRSVKEAAAFVLSRLFSLGVETLLLLLFVSWLGLDELLVKLVISVLVVVMNYITGRFVFKRKKQD